MPAQLIDFPNTRGRHLGPTDPDLADRAKAGDRDAFGELVKRHQATVRGVLRRLSRNTGDADDLSQAAFLKAWTQIRTYSGGKFQSWLCAIAYREFLQSRRRTSSRQARENKAAELTDNYAASSEGMLKLDIDRALGKLPEAQRIAITLCMGAGMSHGEVAIATGWPLGTVKSHINRGKSTLKDLLASYSVA